MMDDSDYYESGSEPASEYDASDFGFGSDGEMDLRVKKVRTSFSAFSLLQA
jgi:hypothetical protein